MIWINEPGAATPIARRLRRDISAQWRNPALHRYYVLPSSGGDMDYEGFFKQRLDALRAEGRYRVFADLERRCGRFPRAYDHRVGAEVTVWCSNDYLGMGQHPACWRR